MRNKLFITGILWIILLTGRVYSDGKMFQERAYKKAPTMPTQRAILKYRNGVETLIIEAAFEAEGKQFGWIIPVPAEPNQMEPVSPGFLKTLSMTIQPEVIHKLGRILHIVIGLAVIIAFWSILVVVMKKDLMFGLLVVLLSASIMYPILMPAFRTAGVSFQSAAQKTESGQITGITVRKTVDIGNYHVSVLKAEHSEALDNWLDKNGFVGLGENGEKIASQYIKEKWYFVAAKLQREGSGLSRPHPISISFPSPKAIYPMRLTSLIDNPLYLELFVIASEKAYHPELTDEVSFAYTPSPIPTDPNLISHHVERKRRWYHPGYDLHMWDGSVMTKLCGVVQPEQMQKDFVFQWKGKASGPRRYYSRRGAVDTSILISLIAWNLLTVVFVAAFKHRIRQVDGRKFVALRIYVPLIVSSSILGTLIYILLPKTDVTILDIDKQSEMFLYHHTFDTENDAIAWAFFDHNIQTKEAAAEYLENYYRFQAMRNPFTNEKICLEDSPGNVMIGEDERGLYIRRFNHRGGSTDYVVEELQRDNVITDYEFNNSYKEFDFVIYILKSDNPGRLIYQYRHVFLELYHFRPKEIVPVIINSLYEDSRWKTMEPDGLEMAVSMLGVVTRIEPPLDVEDTTAVQEFLQAVEAWYNSQGKV